MKIGYKSFCGCKKRNVLQATVQSYERRTDGGLANGFGMDARDDGAPLPQNAELSKLYQTLTAVMKECIHITEKLFNFIKGLQLKLLNFIL